MSKNKIGVIIYSNPDYYPPTINAIHLLSKHFDVHLIARNYEPPHWKYPDNVKVYRLGKYSSVGEREQMSAKAKIREYIKFFTEARRLLKQVSLIYAYDSFAYVAACICKRTYLKSIPVIYQIHEFQENLSLASLSGWIQICEKAWIKQASMIILPDSGRADSFKKNFFLKELPTIVPNFPRKDFYKEHQDWNNQIILERLNSPNILLQGAIAPESSMIELIEALSLLPENIQLKLLGRIKEDNYDLAIKIANQKSLSSRLNYYKPVPYADLPSHTWRASIGVCLYKQVSFNHQSSVTSTNKIYEYAACGLPVIVSNFENYRKYLAGESWVRFADPNKPESIALAVQDILKNFNDYREMCLAARKAFETKFNYEFVFMPVSSKINDLIFK